MAPFHLGHRDKGAAGDPEKQMDNGQEGSSSQEGQHPGVLPQARDGMQPPEIKEPEAEDEYTALDRWITNYDNARRGSTTSQTGSAKRKPKKWWQFWKAAPPAEDDGEHPVKQVGVPPETWLKTDIHQGLTGAEVEKRRKVYGFNELTSDNVSFMTKLFNCFRGPILYGE